MRSLEDAAKRLSERLYQTHPDDIGDGLRRRIQEILEVANALVSRVKGELNVPVNITDKEKF